MSLGELIAAGGKLWLDADLKLRYDGPKELIPAVREHKDELRRSVLAKEWRDRCLSMAEHSEHAQQWRELAALPGRLVMGLDLTQARESFTALWNIAKSDFRYLTGSELQYQTLKLFRGSSLTP